MIYTKVVRYNKLRREFTQRKYLGQTVRLLNKNSIACVCKCKDGNIVVFSPLELDYYVNPKKFRIAQGAFVQIVRPSTKSERVRTKWKSQHNKLDGKIGILKVIEVCSWGYNFLGSYSDYGSIYKKVYRVNGHEVKRDWIKPIGFKRK